MIQRGQIYYANLGRTRGSEQGGIRPVVIVQNDIGNTFSTTTIVCPITSQYKTNLPTHVGIKNLHKDSIILCEQIRVIDKKQIYEERLLGELDKIKIEELNRAIKISVGLDGYDWKCR